MVMASERFGTFQRVCESTLYTPRNIPNHAHTFEAFPHEHNALVTSSRKTNVYVSERLADVGNRIG